MRLESNLLIVALKCSIELLEYVAWKVLTFDFLIIGLWYVNGLFWVKRQVFSTEYISQLVG